MAFVVGISLPIKSASQNASTCALRRPSALAMNAEPVKKDASKAGGDKKPAQGSSFKPKQGGSGNRSTGGYKSNAPASSAKKADASAATSTSSEGPLRFAKDMKQKSVWNIRVANIKDVNALCGMLQEPYNTKSVVEGMVKTGVVVLAEFSVLPPLNARTVATNANNPTSSTAAFARATKPAAAAAADDAAATSAPAATTAASNSSISKKVLAAVMCSVSGAARDPSVGVSSGVVKRGQLLAVYANPQVPEDSQALTKLVLATGKLLQDNQGISLSAKSTKAMSISAEHLEKLGFVNHGADGFVLDLEARTMDPGKKIFTE